MDTTQKTGELLTPSEFHRRRPEMGRNSLYEFLKSGRIRSVRVGRRFLIPESEVEAFVRREASAS